MGFRSFRVVLPSGVGYWTVVDGSYRVVEEADNFLLAARLGRDLAEGTTQAYATALGLFLEWCQGLSVDWRGAGRGMARFVFWLQHHDPSGQHRPGVDEPVRGARRVNAVLAAVREFLRHAVAVGDAAPSALDGLFEVVRDWDLPSEVRGEHTVGFRERPRHRLQEPERTVDAATEDEVLGLVRACRNARDRFIVIGLWRMGARRGELAGARREDAHFLPDARVLGCDVSGPHLHVRKRNNDNGAAAKSRWSRAMPADWLVVQAYDQYAAEREACPAAASCDFLLVNLFAEPLGRPMRPQALNEILAALSRRAGLSRVVHPHMLRHAFATTVMEAGATLDELKELLGHAFLTSSEVYLHPSQERLRRAVEQVRSPRLPEGTRG
ncbi:tyrosine-type recombinase/integrase [Phytomonospora sp. NPDC050363]|uniref:tyrosine-type recombinase/integrase n=1 Tax=Phytomonospora sp. NPDC050363 TaxID=3155642 RepID=UPI0033EFCF58